MAGYVKRPGIRRAQRLPVPESRGVGVRRPFRTHQTVKDVLEAMLGPVTGQASKKSAAKGGEPNRLLDR